MEHLHYFRKECKRAERVIMDNSVEVPQKIQKRIYIYIYAGVYIQRYSQNVDKGSHSHVCKSTGYNIQK